MDRALRSEGCRFRQSPKNEVRVGDGRFLTAMSIAGRPGPRAGAIRTDRQDAIVAYSGDTASACPDRLDVEHGKGKRHAESDIRLILEQDLTVNGDGTVQAGPAHVGGDD